MQTQHSCAGALKVPQENLSFNCTQLKQETSFRIKQRTLSQIFHVYVWLPATSTIYLLCVGETASREAAHQSDCKTRSVLKALRRTCSPCTNDTNVYIQGSQNIFSQTAELLHQPQTRLSRDKSLKQVGAVQCELVQHKRIGQVHSAVLPISTQTSQRTFKRNPAEGAIAASTHGVRLASGHFVAGSQVPEVL